MVGGIAASREFTKRVVPSSGRCLQQHGIATRFEATATKWHGFKWRDARANQARKFQRDFSDAAPLN